MPTFTQDWFGTRLHLIEPTTREFINKTITMLEIGVYEGRSTLWFLENILTHQNAGMIVIDTFEGSLEHKSMGASRDDLRNKFESNISAHKEKVVIRQGKSQNIVHQMRGEIFDLVYIDGSHDASDVLFDALDSFRVLKRGGIIMFDDYTWTHWSDRYKDGVPDRLKFIEEPKMAIDAFLSIFSDDIDVLVKAEQVHIRKR